jgi:hypothetical protein
MTKTQVTKGRDKVRANAAKARQQARQAASQVAPFATSARTTARHGVLRARTWAAPRLERTGNALQDRVAPKMSAMLCSAARRIEPPRQKRRLWPFVTAGLVSAVAAGAAGVLAGRRGKGPLARLGSKPQSTTVSQAEPETAETSTADVNGRVHTS